MEIKIEVRDADLARDIANVFKKAGFTFQKDETSGATKLTVPDAPAEEIERRLNLALQEGEVATGEGEHKEDDT